MSVTTSRLFDFFEQQSQCTVERYVIASAAFSDLRRNLRSMIVSLSENGEQNALEISHRLQSVLSEWLTVPVRFDNSVLLVLREMGGPAAVEARWGRDMGCHYAAACRISETLLGLENPVRTKLDSIFQSLREKGQTFRIFCHKRSREHFESIWSSSTEVALAEGHFLHSVAQYREADLFKVMVKVGPLRSRGWGAAPDALLTAPRFDKLIQIVWSGCGDEADFGYDPVATHKHVGDTSEDTGPVTDNDVSTHRIKWSVQETRSGDGTIQQHDDIPEIDDFQVFSKLGERAHLHRATLVQIDEGHGIFYPPLSRVLALDPFTSSVDYRLPGESLVEGMFLVIPIVDDGLVGGLQAKDGHYSAVWKDKLRAEFGNDPAALENRLWDAGLELLSLRERVAHWCKPPSTVIHAPQSMSHFEILMRVLGIDFDATERTHRPRAAWWQYAWDEVRRTRGEAIHSGFQEQQIVDEQVKVTLLALDLDMPSKVDETMFEVAIPVGQPLHGVLRFYKVLAIEEGFQVPEGELRILLELSRVDQWRA